MPEHATVGSHRLGGQQAGGTRPAGEIQDPHAGLEIEAGDRPVGGTHEEPEGAIVASIGGSVIRGDGTSRGEVDRAGRSGVGLGEPGRQVEAQGHGGRVTAVPPPWNRPMSAPTMDG